MKPISVLLAALVIAGATPSLAQTPRQATFDGASWSFFYYEHGGAERRILTGEPAFLGPQPEAVITVISRDGQPITEATRAHATAFARALCRQSGRQFNSRAQGQFIRAGLSFAGDCTQW